MVIGEKEKKDIETEKRRRERRKKKLQAVGILQKRRSHLKRKTHAWLLFKAFYNTDFKKKQDWQLHISSMPHGDILIALFRSTML